MSLASHGAWESRQAHFSIAGLIVREPIDELRNISAENIDEFANVGIGFLDVS
jgi:hypothetical protein